MTGSADFKVICIHISTIINPRISAFVEPVLDRLPTAQIISQKDHEYTISAEVYGKGIVMWLLSQGS